MEVDPFEGRYGGPSILPMEPALIALIFATCLIGMLICLSFFQKLREWRLGETGSDGLEIQAPKAPKVSTGAEAARVVAREETCIVCRCAAQR